MSALASSPPPRRRARARTLAAALGAVVVAAACSGSATSPPTTAAAPTTSSGARHAAARVASTPRSSTGTRPPVAGRLVVVVLENHSYSDIIGNRQAPYVNSLARRGLSLRDMHAVTHPSQPNYVALFSGGTHGLVDDSCPHRFPGPDLGSVLRRAGLGFAGFSEGLPRTGSATCTAGAYARKHAPWVDFTDLPASVDRPMTAFPRDPARLPTVSFVIPDLDHDMHDGTITQADTWVRTHLRAYADWATAHDSVLVVTWDEDDHSEGNRIPTVVVGAGVSGGVSGAAASRRYDTYGLLRGIEDRYGLPRLGRTATTAPVPLGRVAAG